MSLLLLALAQATNPKCDQVKGAAANDRCLLAQSMALDPPPNCDDQQTQFDMNVCSFRDYLQADIELNESWNAVVERLKAFDGRSGEAADGAYGRLLAGQRAWLQYREKQCSVMAKYYEGGSIAPLEVNGCLTSITKFRTSELKQLLEEN